MYIFIDESGDLGFDFVGKPKTSRYFVVTAVVLDSLGDLKNISQAIKKTTRRKLRSRKRLKEELKGSGTELSVITYFLGLISAVEFDVHVLIFDKQEYKHSVQMNKEEMYNTLAKQLLLYVLKYTKKVERVEIVFDKCKNQAEIVRCNAFLRKHLLPKYKITPNNLVIDHLNSKEAFGLQFVDVISYAIFTKYEIGSIERYNIFYRRILTENIFNKKSPFRGTCP